MVKEPESTEGLVYFTRRKVDDKGFVMAWVYKKECSKCHKATMGKPVEKGKVKIRATEYICPECGYKEEKKAHEESLTLEAKYTCPHCSKEGTATTEYKRKSFEGISSYIIVCEHCGKTLTNGDIFTVNDKLWCVNCYSDRRFKSREERIDFLRHFNRHQKKRKKLEESGDK